MKKIISSYLIFVFMLMTFSGCERIKNSLGLSPANVEIPDNFNKSGSPANVEIPANPKIPENANKSEAPAKVENPESPKIPESPENANKSECPKCQCKEQAETVREIMSRRYPKTRTAMIVSVAILIPVAVGAYVVQGVGMGMIKRNYENLAYVRKMTSVASCITHGAIASVVAYSGYTYFKERKKEREDIMATSDNDKK